MSPDKWEEIKTNVKRQFSVEDEGVEELTVETGEGTVKQGEAEYIVFLSPLGKTKLQFQKKPRLLDKQYFYSKREGDAARVEYKFSEDELVYTLKAYKWNEVEDDWSEIDASSFN